jgi:sulfur carrier protein ThiS
VRTVRPGPKHLRFTLRRDQGACRDIVFLDKKTKPLPACLCLEVPSMESMIEVRAFMGLSDVFRERGWSSPREVAVEGTMTGLELLALLDIAPEQVEVVFVNGKATKADTAVVTGGDRVALAPPGVPGPYRVLLGFKKMG